MKEKLRLRNGLFQALVSIIVAGAPAAVSCGDLPDTTAPLPRSRGGSGGAVGSTGGAGTNSKGGSSSGASGKSGGGSGGSGGSSQAGSGGKGGAGGTAGSGSSEGGAIEPGTGGAEDGGADSGGSAGRGGSGGSLGGAGSGGKSGSGGSSGTGGNVTGEFFGDSRCSSDFDLCEDFEADQLDTGLWEPRSSGGPEPEIDDTRAARGDHSLHVHTEDNGFAYIAETSTFPATNNTYYARMFIHFEALPTEPLYAHWSVSVGLEDGNEAEARIGGQFDGDINRFGVGSDHGPTGDWTNLDEDDPNEVAEGEWICLEWLNKGDTDEGRVWINDIEHPSLHTTATDHGGTDDDYLLPNFDSVWFGWWHYQGGTVPTEFDIWIDEIVVDDERIGCEN